MSSPVYPTPRQADEINILESAVRLTRFLRKHLIWPIVFPILGLLGGYLSNMVRGSVYEGELMLRSRILKADEISFLILSYERSDKSGLSQQERESVRDLSFKTSKEDPYIFARISCEATDTSVFRKLPMALKEYLENIPSVHATAKNVNDANDALINEYTATIQKAGLLLEQTNIDPALAYKNYRNIPDLTLLHEKRRELEIARRDSSAIVIVSDFKPKELHFEKAKALVIGFLVGIIAAATVLFIIYFVDYYHKAMPVKS